MKRITIILNIIFGFGLWFCFCQVGFGQPELLDNIAAVVNDVIITEQEVNTEINQFSKQYANHYFKLSPEALREQVLNKLILESLQLQQAEAVGLQISELALDNMISDIAKEHGQTIQTMQTVLLREGVPYEQYRESIRKQMTLAELQRLSLEHQVHVSDQEVEQFMRSVEGLDALGTEYHLAHLLVSLTENPTPDEIEAAQNQANQLIEKFAADTDLNQAIETTVAVRGTDLGWRKIPELPTLFAEAVPSMRVNEIRGPFRSPSGFHIIKLVGHRQAAIEAEQLTETKVRHILLKVNDQQSEDQVIAQLKQIREEVLNGKEFTRLAKTFSDDLGSKNQGGELGWVTRDTLVPEFETVMAQLSKNEISEPFQTPFGWHIAQVLDRRQANPEARFKQKAKLLIRQRKVEEKRENWLQQLREEAYVQLLPTTPTVTAAT